MKYEIKFGLFSKKVIHGVNRVKNINETLAFENYEGEVVLIISNNNFKSITKLEDK